MQTETSTTIAQVTVAMALPAARYDGLSILLHWLTAMLVLSLWTLGQMIDFIVAGLHAAAALAHHYLLRDSVLRRMLPPPRRDA